MEHICSIIFGGNIVIFESDFTYGASAKWIHMITLLWIDSYETAFTSYSADEQRIEIICSRTESDLYWN